MRLLRYLGSAAIMLTVTAVPARADGFIVPFVGFNFGGDSGSDCVNLTNCEHKRMNFGVSLGSMGAVFGFEEEIGYAKNFFGETPGAANSVISAMSRCTRRGASWMASGRCWPSRAWRSCAASC